MSILQYFRRSWALKLALVFAGGWLLIAGCDNTKETQIDNVAPAKPPPAVLSTPEATDPGSIGGEEEAAQPTPAPEIVLPAGTDAPAPGPDLTAPPSFEELLDRYPELAELQKNMDLTNRDQLKTAYRHMLQLYRQEGLAGLQVFMRGSGLLEALNLDTNYIDFVIAYEEGGIASAEQLARERRLLTADDELRLVLILDTDDASLIEPQVVAVGGRILLQFENEVEIGIPLDRLVELATSEEALAQLVKLAHLEHVISVRAPDYTPANQQTTEQNEGVSKTQADIWHASGLTGKDMKVGIIDPDGFGGYQTLLGNTLPGEERVHISPDFTRAFLNDRTDVHGTACAEVVHAMAPEATLYLAYTAGTYQGLGRAVDWLLANEVDIISYSAGSIVGPMDGTGKLASLVQKAADENVLWINSSGNHALAHLNLVFADTDGDGWHEFPGGGEAMPFSALAGQSHSGLGLSWNDSWGGATQDYDLYILQEAAPGEAPEIVASQRNVQGGRAADEPYELLIASLADEGSYFVAVRGNEPDYPGRLNLLGHGVEFSYSMPAGSLNTPGDAAEALTVGATTWRDDAIPAYSSRGPTNDGRGKPNLSAPTGITTASYDGAFLGTSPSAPHAAGAAALVWQAFPQSSATEVRDYLLGNSVDLEPAGFDNATGYGRLRMPQLPAVAASEEAGAPQATIHTLWQEHNVFQAGQKGMVIHAGFDIAGFQGQAGHVRARFLDRGTGQYLLDGNQSYGDAEGRVAAIMDFIPAYSWAHYSDEVLFMPYAELDLALGSYALELEVDISDAQSGQALSPPVRLNFAYSQANPARPAAVIDDVSFSHDAVRDGEPGLEIEVSFDVANLQDQVVEIAAYFYFDGVANRPLRDFNDRYRSSGGVVSAGRAFTVEETTQSFRRFALFIPYSELHLSQGQHNLKFHLAVHGPDGERPLATSDWVYFWHAQSGE
ncbi:MAG: S8 family serine peptidase [Chloroflexota bacterium]|nr:MAG: S8 family serine peptidase [Chloroflexota bacterium]